MGHALDGWYTPDGLSALLHRDDARAHAELAQLPFDYGFPLRPYQQRAILAIEANIRDGRGLTGWAAKNIRALLPRAPEAAE